MIIYCGNDYNYIIQTFNKLPHFRLISGNFTSFALSVNEYLSLNNKTCVNIAFLLKTLNINKDALIHNLSYFEYKKLEFLSAIIRGSFFIVFEEPSLFLTDNEKCEMAQILNLFNLPNLVIFEKNISFCKKIKGNIRYLPPYPKTSSLIN